MKNNRIVALLLAGGQGTRIQPTCPKQFMEVRGESILLHTMRAFESHPLVTDIVVVCVGKWAPFVKAQAAIGHITKLTALAEAGETSYGSLCNGIRALAENEFDGDTIVLVHDSVRPFVSFEIISNNITVCQNMGNAVTGIQSNETYLKIDNKRTIGEESISSIGYIPREQLMRAQTPITFKLQNLQEVVQLAARKGISDSQSLVTLINELDYCSLNIVKGDLMNFKITLPEDIDIYRKLSAY